MDLTVLLYQNGYPPEWDEEVFDKVLAQAKNFKKFAASNKDSYGYAALRMRRAAKFILEQRMTVLLLV